MIVMEARNERNRSPLIKDVRNIVGFEGCHYALHLPNGNARRLKARSILQAKIEASHLTGIPQHEFDVVL